MIKSFVAKLLPEKSNRHLFIYWVLRSHIHGVVAVARSIYSTKKLTGDFFPIQCLVYPKMQLHLKVDKTADVQLKGKLHLDVSWSGSGASYIEVNENAHLIIKGDFHIGQNVKVMLAKSATLILGGGNVTWPSGITSDSRVFVAENIIIGKGTIISWDCFITDSDWHQIEHTVKTKPVHIGDCVWISHGVSILKGAKVGEHSIVGAKSTVSTIYSQDRLLLVGTPARIIKENVTWTR